MSEKQGLFGDLPEARASEKVGRGGARLRQAERHQVELMMMSLDELLPSEHRARIVWSFVEKLDLSALVAQIRSVEGGRGAPTTDPRILLALWLYATLEGVGSARELDRLCQVHHGFRWICGGVGMNYHTLSDFRVGHGAFLDELLTESVAVLLHSGLASLDRVAQDGMKVRAAAGSNSFRRRGTLEAHRDEAARRIAALRRDLGSDAQTSQRRQKAARERAAREQAERIEKALKALPEVAAKRKRKGKPEEDARASKTDAEARIMKMPNGGYGPAYNVQFSSTTEGHVIVGVEVTNASSDQGQAGPMMDQIERRYGRRPTELLTDGGYVAVDDLVAIAQQGTTIYAPVPEPRKGARDRFEPRPEDQPEIAAWRRRMASEEAQAIYRQRAATAECVNAHARNRNLQRLTVRGSAKAKAVALWYAIAHNLMRAASLGLARPAAA
jgi:transposase